MSELFSLQKQYDFYKKYHKSRINRSIHILCIPILVWTAEVIFSYIEFDDLLYISYNSYKKDILFGIVKFNGASIMCTFYTSYYLILNLRLGIIMYLESTLHFGTFW